MTKLVSKCPGQPIWVSGPLLEGNLIKEYVRVKVPGGMVTRGYPCEDASVRAFSQHAVGEAAQR
jgi:hypothetical protein